MRPIHRIALRYSTLPRPSSGKEASAAMINFVRIESPLVYRKARLPAMDCEST